MSLPKERLGGSIVNSAAPCLRIGDNPVAMPTSEYRSAIRPWEQSLRRLFLFHFAQYIRRSEESASGPAGYC
jgi:hypothetical protein